MLSVDIGALWVIETREKGAKRSETGFIGRGKPQASRKAQTRTDTKQACTREEQRSALVLPDIGFINHITMHNSASGVVQTLEPIGHMLRNALTIAVKQPNDSRRQNRGFIARLRVLAQESGLDCGHGDDKGITRMRRSQTGCPMDLTKGLRDRIQQTMIALRSIRIDDTCLQHCFEG